MPDIIYLRFLKNGWMKQLNLETDTIYLALMTAAHVQDQTDDVWADVVANEVANGAGYTTNGVALAGKAVTQADPTKWDATDAQWVALTKAFRYGVIWDDTPADVGNVDPLIGCFDFGAQSVTAVTLNIVFDAAGIITLTPP